MKNLSKLAIATAFAAAVATSAAAAPTTEANDPFVSTALARVSPFAIIGIVAAITVLGAADNTE